LGESALQNEEFEWDDDKAAANLKKHKISFDVARRVFGDPGLIDEIDEGDYDEERFRAVGMIDGRLVAVIYTVREARVRIISARKATRKEQTDYVEHNS
jgi:hypothetical protein